MPRAFRVLDGYWYPQADFDLELHQGIPKGYTRIDPRPLLEAKKPDEYIVRSYAKDGDYWTFTDQIPSWDKQAYEARLNQHKLAAIINAEGIFDRVLALGMPYDFGATGITAKQADPRTGGGNNGFTFTLSHPRGDVSVDVAHDDGILHIQARKNNRSDAHAAYTYSQQREARGITDPLPFQTTENTLVEIDAQGYDDMTFALGGWYTTVFYQLQQYKFEIRNLTSIQDVNEHPLPSFS